MRFLGKRSRHAQLRLPGSLGCLRATTDCCWRPAAANAAAAEPFWRSLDFEQNGDSKPYIDGTVSSTVRLRELPLVVKHRAREMRGFPPVRPALVHPATQLAVQPRERSRASSTSGRLGSQRGSLDSPKRSGGHLWFHLSAGRDWLKCGRRRGLACLSRAGSHRRAGTYGDGTDR